MTETKTVLVTGASRGIGASIFSVLGNAGYRVIGTATSQSGADKIQSSAVSSGFNGSGRVLDISDADSVTHFVAQLKEEGELPDILVNNAGITRDNLLMRMSDDEWQAVIQTNLTGVFTLSRALLRPMMKKRWGRIINIGSIVGQTGNAGQTNYCAAKAGLEGFSKALAIEVATRGITVNVVAPGFIQTDMTDALNEAHKEALLQKIPAQRMGQPEDIAAAVAFLASDTAGYVTGVTLPVNGGMAMY